VLFRKEEKISGSFCVSSNVLSSVDYSNLGWTAKSQARLQEWRMQKKWKEEVSTVIFMGRDGPQVDMKKIRGVQAAGSSEDRG